MKSSDYLKSSLPKKEKSIIKFVSYDFNRMFDKSYSFKIESQLAMRLRAIPASVTIMIKL
jgi:hypothetical protein